MAEAPTRGTVMGAEGLDLTKLSIVDANYLENLPIEQPVEVVKPKKKKLTKEEKKQRKLLAQQEFQKMEMRDHLIRELELSKKSAARGHAEWMDLCREIKVEELREEVKGWMERAQHMFEEKDEKVTRMLEDMDAIKELHERSFAGQISIIDHLTDCYRAFRKTTANLYEDRAYEMIKQFEEDIRQHLDADLAHRQRVENVNFVTNLIVTHKLVESEDNYRLNRSNIVDTQVNMRLDMRDRILEKIDTLRTNLHKFINETTDTTLDPKKFERFDQLVNEERNFVKETAQLDTEELESNKAISDLQHELRHHEAESIRKFRQLNAKAKHFYETRKNVENAMKRDWDETLEKMALVTVETTSLEKLLGKMLRMGRLMLDLSNTCATLETPNERASHKGEFSHLKHSFEEKSYFKLKVIDLKETLGIVEEDVADQIHGLQNFWRREALVETHVAMLREHRDRLQQENERYQDMIKALGPVSEGKDLAEFITYETLVPEVIEPCVGYKLKMKKRKKKKKEEENQFFAITIRPTFMSILDEMKSKSLIKIN